MSERTKVYCDVCGGRMSPGLGMIGNGAEIAGPIKIAGKEYNAAFKVTALVSTQNRRLDLHTACLIKVLNDMNVGGKNVEVEDTATGGDASSPG